MFWFGLFANEGLVVCKTEYRFDHANDSGCVCLTGD